MAKKKKTVKELVLEELDDLEEFQRAVKRMENDASEAIHLFSAFKNREERTAEMYVLVSDGLDPRTSGWLGSWKNKAQLQKWYLVRRSDPEYIWYAIQRKCLGTVRYKDVKKFHKKLQV